MMARRIDRNLVSLSMFGYLVWLTVVSVVHADGKFLYINCDTLSYCNGVGWLPVARSCQHLGSCAQLESREGVEPLPLRLGLWVKNKLFNQHSETYSTIPTWFSK